MDATKVFWKVAHLITMCDISTRLADNRIEAWGVVVGNEKNTFGIKQYWIDDVHIMKIPDDYDINYDEDGINVNYPLYFLRDLNSRFEGQNVLGVFHSHPFSSEYDNHIYQFIPSMRDTQVFTRHNLRVNPIINVIPHDKCPEYIKNRICFTDEEIIDVETSCIIYVWEKDMPTIFRNAITDLKWNNMYALYLSKRKSGTWLVSKVRTGKWEHEEFGI